jgi:hypothetical protein
LFFNRLLTSPFEYSEAFDRALKEVVKTLPGRPAKETADEVVCVRDIKAGFFWLLTGLSNRTTTAHTLVLLENFLATHAHWDPST